MAGCYVVLLALRVAICSIGAIIVFRAVAINHECGFIPNHRLLGSSMGQLNRRMRRDAPFHMRISLFAHQTKNRHSSEVKDSRQDATTQEFPTPRSTTR